MKFVGFPKFKKSDNPAPVPNQPEPGKSDAAPEKPKLLSEAIQEKPKTLSEAIKQGSKKSTQAFGTFFGGTKEWIPAPVFPAGSPAGTSASYNLDSFFTKSKYLTTNPKSTIKKLSDHWWYDSFVIKRGSMAAAQQWSMFQVSVGQGWSAHGGAKTWNDTNSMAGGTVPLDKHFLCSSIQVKVTEPIKYPIMTWLNGCTISFRTSIIENILGPAPIFIKEQTLKHPYDLQPGMSFMFKVTVDDASCMDKLINWIDNTKHNDFIKFYLIMRGSFMESV